MALLLILIVVLLIFVFLCVLDWIVRSITVKSSINLTKAHVMITGGSSGIGLALAKQFLEQGANVTLVARNKMKLVHAMAEVERKKRDSSQKVCIVSVDITKDADVIKNSIDEACNAIGPVDILVNCAGFAVCGSFQETNVEDFRVMMETNYLGSVHVTKCLIDGMIKRRNGHIVFVSSIGGQVGVYGYTAYSPSKYAVRGFAEILYSELKPYNIGVSIVFPPDTDTPGFENENRSKPEATKLISESGGLFAPEEVAKSIIKGIETRQFSIWCGFDGFMMNTLTCGASPASSLSELLIQVLLMGPLRLLITFYLCSFGRIIQRCVNDEEEALKQKEE